MIQHPPHAPVDRYFLDRYHRLNIDVRFYEKWGWLWPAGAVLVIGLFNKKYFPHWIWWLSVALVAIGITLAAYGHLRFLRKERAQFAKDHPKVAAEYNLQFPKSTPCPNPSP